MLLFLHGHNGTRTNPRRVREVIEFGGDCTSDGNTVQGLAVQTYKTVKARIWPDKTVKTRIWPDKTVKASI